MPRPATDKRERLAQAALDLCISEGFDRASIADIAAKAGVASGSVYYYFKTKDDVGAAVVERLQEVQDAAIAEWNFVGNPAARLVALVESYRADAASVVATGSPLGAVAAQLGRQSGELGTAAGAVFQALIDWAAAQFEALEFDPAAVKARALHLVTVMEGAAAMAAALDSAEPLDREAAHLTRWIQR